MNGVNCAHVKISVFFRCALFASPNSTSNKFGLPSATINNFPSTQTNPEASSRCPCGNSILQKFSAVNLNDVFFGAADESFVVNPFVRTRFVEAGACRVGVVAQP